MSEKIAESAERIITGIWGAEPLREGEYPDSHMVGHSDVTRIVRRDENLGTYGIVWFDVFKGEDLAWSCNASFVASIRYGASE
jgi:hypothetical protein